MTFLKLPNTSVIAGISRLSHLYVMPFFNVLELNHSC